jgi:AhpD family alkylhydroperoxidase
MEFRTHTVESAPPASRELLAGLQEQVGFVPNLAATMAASPALLQTFLGLRQSAGASELDPVSREIVAIAVAVETGCGYCVAAHSTFALKNGADRGAVEAARSGKPLPDPKLDALARFAKAVVRRDGSRAKAEDLAKAGLAAGDVLDLLAVIATPMLASTVAQLADVELDAAFQPQAWSRR